MYWPLRLDEREKGTSAQQKEAGSLCGRLEQGTMKAMKKEEKELYEVWNKGEEEKNKCIGFFFCEQVTA